MTIWTQMGCQSDELKVVVHWFDHNGCDRITMVKVVIEEQDKPRTLAVEVGTVPELVRDMYRDDISTEQVYRYES
jgi:hypothetical protein